jgi:hypothetical protein
MIEKDELLNIKGGVAKYFYGVGITAVVSFVIGFIDGYMRPLACRK